MELETVRLTNFRSYACASLSPTPGINVLCGQNAAGKTNVLEAVFLCALGRSHRSTRDAELVRAGEQAARAEATVRTRGGTRVVRAQVYTAERKRMLVDGAPLARTGELMGCLNVVMFAPEDLALVKNGPSERRRLVDMLLSQTRPRYYYQLQQYNHALKQRNVLLKEENAHLRATLPHWDEQLARLGAAITAQRSALLARMGELASERHALLAGDAERLTVRYMPNLALSEEADMAARMREQLAAGLYRDMARGATCAGPHRDDVSLLLDGREARVYGSQGQQRTTVLALKLAEIDLQREAAGEAPVLLLDDVFSELDETRQRQLLSALAGCQSLVTCTEPPRLLRKKSLGAALFLIQDGTIGGMGDVSAYRRGRGRAAAKGDPPAQ